MSKYVWKGAPEHGGTLAAVRGFLFNHYGCDAVAESACAGLICGWMWWCAISIFFG